jgi:hypothetical protein
VVAIAKESGEKLVALVGCDHRDQEEAQNVKSERDELSQASKQLQADLDSICLEREHALSERRPAKSVI